MPNQTDINTENLTINEINEKRKKDAKRNKTRLRRRVILTLIIATLIEVPLVFFAARYYENHKSSASGKGCNFEIPWYEQYNIITHALGTVDGRVETNSKEAFLESYARGARVFEADMCLTADGYLVIRHDFSGTSYYNLEQKTDETDDGQIIYGTYMHTKICYLYTPLDIDGMLSLMEEYRDTYLVTDSKYTDENSVKEEFRRLNEAIERTGDDELKKRIIVQIYSYDMLDWVKSVYDVPSENIILTLYNMYPRDFEEIGGFCKEKGVPVVAMSCEITEKDAVSTLHGYGVKVYAHTENRIKQMLSDIRYKGVDGFYSDYVTNEEYSSAYDALYGDEPIPVYSDEMNETEPPADGENSGEDK